MISPVKLSFPATRGFWEIPTLFEDEQLLALDKPAGLFVSADPVTPGAPGLVTLLHAAIRAGKPWVVDRKLSYLAPSHRLDPDATGVLLFAKSKPVLAALLERFTTESPGREIIALVQGTPTEDRFEVTAQLGPHPDHPGRMRIDTRSGKKSRTRFEVIERFTNHALVKCEPITDRPEQIRLHLRRAGLRVVSDPVHGGGPLYLSRLKRDYRLKEGRVERPLISRVALHSARIALPHPVNGTSLDLVSPWPKDLRVAVKYLREYSA